MLYESITVWQAGKFLLKLHSGLFDSDAEVRTFTAQPLHLSRNLNLLILTSAKSGETLETIDDPRVVVLKLKETAIGKTPVVITDYDEVSIPIRAFSLHRDLKAFKHVGSSLMPATDLRIDPLCKSITPAM